MGAVSGSTGSSFWQAEACEYFLAPQRVGAIIKT